MRAALPNGAEGTGTSVTILGDAQGNEFSYNAKNAATSRIFAELTDESEFTTTNGVQAADASVAPTVANSTETTVYNMQVAGSAIAFRRRRRQRHRPCPQECLGRQERLLDASVTFIVGDTGPGAYTLSFASGGNQTTATYIIAEDANGDVPSAEGQAQIIRDAINAAEIDTRPPPGPTTASPQ